MIDEFGSLSRALAAAPTDQRRVLDDDRAVALLGSVQVALVHSLRREIEDRPTVPTHAALLDYLHVQMGHSSLEEVRVLFLDRRHHLIRDEVMSRGTVDEAAIHIREILKRALELGAVGLILVHNHPAGDPTPSRADKVATLRLADAANAMQMTLHDHLIVASSGSISFSALGLL